MYIFSVTFRFSMDSRANTNTLKKQARKEGVSYHAMYMRKKRKEQDSAKEQKPRCRPRKTTIDDDKWLIKRAKRHKFDSSVTHCMQLRKQRECRVAPCTIRRRLLEGELVSRIAVKKPLLSQKHKEQRIEYAHAAKRRNWKNVLFSDETSIYLGHRRKYARTKRGTKVFCAYDQTPTKDSCLGLHFS
jgi:hypothetical protein